MWTQCFHRLHRSCRVTALARSATKVDNLHTPHLLSSAYCHDLHAQQPGAWRVSAFMHRHSDLAKGSPAHADAEVLRL